MASAVHLLIGDITGTTSVEFSHLDTIKFEMVDGQLAHSNHFIVPHAEGVSPHVFSLDSRERIVRARKLLVDAAKGGKSPTMSTIEAMLEDEEGLPGAINRMASEKSPSSTLFGIVMDLSNKTARVRLGRPTECKQVDVLSPAML